MDAAAWARFVDLYTPLLFRWSQRMGLSYDDASDLVQDIFTVLINKLKTFDYDATQSFRAWLKTITKNRAKNFLRAQNIRPSIGVESDIASEAQIDSELDLIEKREYESYITKRMLELVKDEFREDVWQAFYMQVFKDEAASDVALHLGLSINSVYLAKSRVLRRMREESRDLMD